MNQSLYNPMGALDPYGLFGGMGGEFQQNPEQLLVDNYNPPENPMAVNDQPMLDPQRAAYAAALSNIGNIFMGQAPSQSVGGAYISAKAQNDKLRQNKAARQRQIDQDALRQRLVESQIAKNTGGGVDPANVSEWKYYSELSPEQQEQYLNMKRASRYFDMGGVQMQASQTGPTAAPVQAVAPGGVVDSPKTQEEIATDLANQEAEKQSIIAQQKSAVKTADTYFEKLPQINQGISNLNRGIELIDQGAETGPIAQYMPTFTQASLELEALKNELGLDVVSSVTFGGLSAGELKLALDTAIPPLDDPDLRQWMERKRDAQVKLKNNLEEAALFLSQPGNTRADWLKKTRGRSAASDYSAMSDEDLLK